jgi:hypothetical protein
MRPEAVNAAGNLVHAFAQFGNQAGIKKILDDDKTIILERFSPLVRFVLNRRPSTCAG